MGGEGLGVTEVEVLPSMWPDDLGNGKQFNIEKPGVNRDIQEDVNIKEDPSIIDFERLRELTDYSEKGSSQLAYLVKHWEYRQANAVRLLNEELSILSKQREEVELKKLEILEALRFQDEKFLGDKRIISVLDEDEIYDIWGRVPRKKHDVFAYARQLDIDAEYDTIKYWKQRAMELEKLLEASIHREQALMQMLQENIKNLEKQSSPVEELSKILKRADNFLHFVLQNAPVVFGHQDKELRYRFIYNHYPKLAEEDIIGKTDKDIFSGVGVDEIHNMKQEVLKEGKSAKREMTFKTDLFGAKTFMIYVEPVFSKAGETIGVNYMGMDVTDQVDKREEMIKLREEIAVQKAKETELNKTIHITEETMRSKQMLATMSHEIRSPLAGVVSMADILSNTNLDKEQRQLLDVMLSSGDLVLQLINDILDLSKVESGAMKLEATKFRPREVVKHVLQTAAASLQKELVLEGHVSDSVPIEVIGDVLRIRQILTNLISNAIKFTHKGKVEINLHVVSQKCPRCQEENKQVLTADGTVSLSRRQLEDKSIKPQGCNNGETSNCLSCQEDFDQSCTMAEKTSLIDEVTENHNQTHEKTVWLQCDVCDTGIGIPESALPTLFKKYMQASADHARKYGGTGLGLAICKQLVELMGGHLTVTSQEHHGSTFTFMLPCKVPSRNSAMSDHKLRVDASSDESSGSFYFQPHKFGTSSRSMVRKPKVFGSRVFDALNSANGLPGECDSFSSSDDITETALIKGVSSVPNPTETSIEHEGAPLHNVEQNINNNTEVVNRREENCQDDKPSTRTCSELVKTENSKSRLTCQSPSHTRDSNFQSTTKGSTELSKTNSQPKILLVEDNKINIMVAQSMMKQMGHSMDIVNNGLEAIRAFQHSHYDLILMDVCMPVMDGLQATRLIRSYEKNGYWDASVAADIDQAEPCSDFPSGSPYARRCQKRTTIIAMTANALSESAEDCLASGMDSFVSKPVTSQKLKQCLEQYLSC